MNITRGQGPHVREDGLIELPERISMDILEALFGRMLDSEPRILRALGGRYLTKESTLRLQAVLPKVAILNEGVTAHLLSGPEIDLDAAIQILARYLAYTGAQERERLAALNEVSREALALLGTAPAELNLDARISYAWKARSLTDAQREVYGRLVSDRLSGSVWEPLEDQMAALGQCKAIVKALEL